MESCHLQPSKWNLRALCSEVKDKYSMMSLMWNLQLKNSYRQQMGVLPEVGSKAVAKWLKKIPKYKLPVIQEECGIQHGNSTNAILHTRELLRGTLKFSSQGKNPAWIVNCISNVNIGYLYHNI